MMQGKKKKNRSVCVCALSLACPARTEPQSRLIIVRDGRTDGSAARDGAQKLERGRTLYLEAWEIRPSRETNKKLERRVEKKTTNRGSHHQQVACQALFFWSLVSALASFQ
ncbi:hypothetical protein CCM_03770 [Cordyceps militaris CM01]|uniref:Uncharacterized protein n=1 Tax=Cordyceps militaris (strain CM01) TaxID=983644 RepID=G3JGI0_CORMM|nr:uncharacterized protein CCM_03770 [Cordyceps militaris CM01]EGX92397.1 hypothetical protein CCM_03770 [Cordyceps militaris CM01]